MNASELRELSLEELEDELVETREELMRFRFQQATGELTDHNQMHYTRKRIARMLTIINELKQKELSGQEGEE
ncbi:MAG: 50S ribosomal protein L29 [Anaerolineae bacterium]|nr:50S ribosomal protein L29 [Anaerolineae bacterium]